MINENHNQVTEERNMKEDIFKRLDKRKENLEQQRSAHASERSKNAAENQAILNKVSLDTGSVPALRYLTVHGPPTRFILQKTH
jgi:hypothetical protein